MDIPNLDQQFAWNKLIDLEGNICVFYMQYIAFGFMFSGTMEQLAILTREINNLQYLWGYMHRN